MRSMRPAPTHAHATLSFFHPSIHACIFVCVRFRHGLSPPLPCATSISFRSTRPTVCLNFSERGIYTATKPEGKGFFLGLGGRGCARCMRLARGLARVVRLSRHFEIWDMWAGGCDGDLYGKIGEDGNLLSFDFVTWFEPGTRFADRSLRVKRDCFQGLLRRVIKLLGYKVWSGCVSYRRWRGTSLVSIAWNWYSIWISIYPIYLRYTDGINLSWKEKFKLWPFERAVRFRGQWISVKCDDTIRWKI